MGYMTISPSRTRDYTLMLFELFPSVFSPLRDPTFLSPSGQLVASWCLFLPEPQMVVFDLSELSPLKRVALYLSFCLPSAKVECLALSGSALGLIPSTVYGPLPGSKP